MTELEIAMKAVQLYAESHPRPLHVTQTQAADMLDLSRSTISRLIASGKIRLNGVGLIPIADIDELLSAQTLHTRPRNARHA